MKWPRWVKRFSLSENPAKDPALAALFGYSPVSSGVNVSEDKALNFSAVWRAVSLISGSLASLPLHLYRRKDDGRDRADSHPVAKILRNPNPEMSAMVFRETLQAHVLTWGNAYAEIVRSGGGRPIALVPIAPNRVRVERDAQRNVVYRVGNPDGTATTLQHDEMLHVPGLGFDGLVGYSVIRRARESIGLGLATEQFGAAFFGNGAWPGIVAEYPGKLTKEAIARLRESWNLQHMGPDNAHKFSVLEEGMKVSKGMSIPPDDAQFLETRKFQVVEIARWFGVAPHKLMDLERATFSNIEHQALEYLQDTLRPWLVRWEQECDRKLLMDGERDTYYCEHLVDALLTVDIAARYNAYAVARNWGWLSADDVRRKENMNALPDGQGEIYLIPANMMPADKARDMPAGTQPPAKEQPPAKDEDDPERSARLAAAQRLVFTEAVQRMVRLEGIATGRAAAKGADALLAWSEEFYGHHQVNMAAALVGPVRAHLAATGSDADPEAVVAKLAKDYVSRSLQELSALLETKPKAADLARKVERMAAQWEVTRPGELADSVFSGEKR